MYRSVLALLFASVLLLSGCAAERQRVPREKDTQEAEKTGQSSDMSGEESCKQKSIAEMKKVPQNLHS